MTVDTKLPYVQLVHAFYSDDANKDKAFKGSFKYSGTMTTNVGSHALKLYMQEDTNKKKTEEQASSAIRKLCGKSRATIIQPNVGKRKFGDLSTMSSEVSKESSKISNPITEQLTRNLLT